MNAMLSLPSLRSGWIVWAVVAAACVAAGLPVLQWTFLEAIWSGDPAQCRAAAGACWSFIRDRFMFLMAGFYPPEEYARPLAVVVIHAVVVLAIAASETLKRRLFLAYLAILSAFAASVYLLAGDGLILEPVPSRLWTGFALTLTVASGGIALGMALGLLLAFGRAYAGRYLSAACTAVIETLRALPIIVTMFVVVVLAPYALPASIGESTILRIMFGFVLGVAAFYAEAVRGALETIEAGQAEAARSLGMKRLTIFARVILPQVVALSFPALMNVNLMVVKDTVLILALGYYELLGAGNAVLNTAEWRSYVLEMFVVIYLVFWLVCWLISYAGRAVEANLYLGSR
ncbi:ABC transporter permease subunit [Mesorhizobium sp.]|uniref:ABC transporter permease subunit n=1 Tax=Mesorhizobium sp. TaxID=1871066 RepID=UPI0011F9435D|nr:ABC transporter permease subunit [Mesorhizobium sp.]TIS68560.1 MAG: ABC transporter permease subunit [Mesorhizobium sp.]